MHTFLVVMAFSLAVTETRSPDPADYRDATGHHNAYCDPDTGGDGGEEGGGETPPGGPIECDLWDCGSPIVLDLGYDYPQFGGPKTAVFFDLLGSGNPMLLQWVNAGGNDAFLVMDLNDNGVIDDGTELFGEGTRLILENHKRALNGFIGLQQWDDPRLGGNNDGFISAEDLFFEDLALWLDIDADGETDPGEIKPLTQYSIYELEIIPVEQKIQDKHGNWLRFWAWSFSNSNPNGNKPITMVDVYFRVLRVIGI